jgi:transposase-like protein
MVSFNRSPLNELIITGGNVKREEKELVSERVKKKGTYHTRQRYLCKDCEKSLTDVTTTPLVGTCYP